MSGQPVRRSHCKEGRLAARRATSGALQQRGQKDVSAGCMSGGSCSAWLHILAALQPAAVTERQECQAGQQCTIAAITIQRAAKLAGAD